jgi:hypothetical protein
MNSKQAALDQALTKITEPPRASQSETPKVEGRKPAG